MKKVLITGSGGQIGSELVMELRKRLGNSNVVASDKRDLSDSPLGQSGPFEIIDVTDGQDISDVAKKYNIDTIYHLAAVLSAVGEEKPQLAWDIGVNGLYNVLQVAKETVAAAEEDFNLVQEKYNLGAATILEVLDAQVSLVEAENSQVEAKYDYNLSVASLEKAMGVTR